MHILLLEITDGEQDRILCLTLIISNADVTICINHLDSFRGRRKAGISSTPEHTLALLPPAPAWALGRLEVHLPRTDHTGAQLTGICGNCYAFNRGNAKLCFYLKPPAGVWPWVSHCSNKEPVFLFVCVRLSFGSLRGCGVIKRVDIQSHHVIVAIQHLPVVVAEGIFSSYSYAQKWNIQSALKASPFPYAQPWICLKDCNIVRSAELWGNHPPVPPNADECWIAGKHNSKPVHKSCMYHRGKEGGGGRE